MTEPKDTEILFEFDKEIEEFCDGLKSGKYKTKTLKAEYSISEDEIQEFRSNWKKLQQMQHNRKMNIFEKLQAGWWWIGECFDEWCWTMTHDDGEFFNYIQTDYVKYEEDTYYD